MTFQNLKRNIQNVKFSPLMHNVQTLPHMHYLKQLSRRVIHKVCTLKGERGDPAKCILARMGGGGGGGGGVGGERGRGRGEDQH